MLTLIGFLVILSIVTLLLIGKISPIVGLTLIPITGALVVGTGISEIGDLFLNGLDSVIDVVIMFVFAILFFGIMRDTGLFEPMINRMVALTRGNIIGVAIVTVLIATVASLDGSGASTFLITIPALLPLYQRLNMSPYLLMLLTATGIGILNMLPWGGPIGRAASVIGTDPVDLWRPLIPLQLTGIVLLILMAVILGMREKRRIQKAGLSPSVEEKVAGTLEDSLLNNNEEESEGQSVRRPRLIWVNFLLTILVITILVWGVIPSGYAFMIGVALALVINYPNKDQQMDRIKAHSSSALTMAAIILSAGSFLGILEGTGMLEAIATSMVGILPNGMVPYIHLIIGFFGLPMDLLLTTDAYYFALLPIVEQIVTGYGVESTTAVYALAVGNNIGAQISPFAPALWLGIGLAGVEMGKHIRYSFLWMWGFSIVMFLLAIAMNIIVL